MDKELRKNPIKTPRKPRISKFNLVMLAFTIVSFGLIIYAIMSYINKPNTYAELEPMMEEAQAFDQKAAELSGQYETIEDQLGEDLYFETVEDGYEQAAVVQRRMMEDIAQTNDKIREAGGITTYEELQRVRVPAADKYVEGELQDYFENNGYDIRGTRTTIEEVRTIENTVAQQESSSEVEPQDNSEHQHQH